MSKFRAFEKNSNGRDFICGDIHGMYKVLLDRLKELDFDTRKDRLFCVGDLIDRGDNSWAYRKFLKQPWFFSLMGNHEVLACKALVTRDHNDHQQWIMNGGDWIFDIDQTQIDSVARDLRQLPLAFQLELQDGRQVGLTHAEIATDDWNETVTELQQLDADAWDFPADSVATRLLWSRTLLNSTDSRQCDNIDHVFHGHTPIDEIITLGNRSYIDLGCFSSGNIAVISPDSFLAD